MTARGERGQAIIELVGAVPLVVAVIFGAGQALAAGLARELADHAAEAAAVAVLQGADPRDAARRAVPGWARERVTVRVGADEIRVRLRPPTVVPGTASLLTASASATTGARS